MELSHLLTAVFKLEDGHPHATVVGLQDEETGESIMAYRQVDDDFVGVSSASLPIPTAERPPSHDCLKHGTLPP